jgi:hypothetical protein
MPTAAEAVLAGRARWSVVWLLQHALAEPANVLDAIMRLRKQDRERGQRMSPETAGQQRFVKQWPAREPWG